MFLMLNISIAHIFFARLDTNLHAEIVKDLLKLAFRFFKKHTEDAFGIVWLSLQAVFYSELQVIRNGGDVCAVYQ